MHSLELPNAYVPGRHVATKLVALHDWPTGHPTAIDMPTAPHTKPSGHGCAAALPGGHS